MIRTPDQRQTWTHTELGLARFGVCAPALAVDDAQDWSTDCRAGFFRDGRSVLSFRSRLFSSQVTGRRFGVGPFPRPRHRPIVSGPGARLSSFNSRRSSLFPRMRPVGRLLPGRPGALFFLAGAYGLAAAETLCIHPAQHLPAKLVEPIGRHLSRSIRSRSSDGSRTIGKAFAIEQKTIVTGSKSD